MKLFFYLQYDTIFGQDLRLNIMGETTAKGDRASENTVYAMTTVEGKMWQCEIELEKAPKSINYFYSIDKWGKEERQEWQTVTHRLDMNVKYITAGQTFRTTRFSIARPLPIA